MPTASPIPETIGGILERDSRGLYCPAGRFWIDPSRKVERAVVTHAHSDHARPGSLHYLTTVEGEEVLRLRMGPKPDIQTVKYGEGLMIGDARVSLHPAGHVLGSAQVRVEVAGRVVVVSGDYKVESDPTCAPFEAVKCDAFVTEATFALPIFRWRKADAAFEEIHGWWRENQEAGRCSVMTCYALGKAQRILAGLDPSYGPVLVDPLIQPFVEAYRRAGVRLPPTALFERDTLGKHERLPLIIATPASRVGWGAGFHNRVSTASASGWMALGRFRRRDWGSRGFVLSDHADWDGLLSAIRATEAREIWVTHGYTNPFARWLGTQGWDAHVLELPLPESRVGKLNGEPAAQLHMEWDED